MSPSRSFPPPRKRPGEAATPAAAVYPTLTAEEWVAANRRPAALPALDAGFAALQILDIWSTRRAISRGAIEANPVMKRMAGNPAAFWTVKVAATVGPMLVAERLWRRNRVAAITLMAASNGVLAAVAAHNASVLKRQR